MVANRPHGSVLLTSSPSQSETDKRERVRSTEAISTVGEKIKWGHVTTRHVGADRHTGE